MLDDSSNMHIICIKWLGGPLHKHSPMSGHPCTSTHQCPATLAQALTNVRPPLHKHSPMSGHPCHKHSPMSGHPAQALTNVRGHPCTSTHQCPATLAQALTNVRPPLHKHSPMSGHPCTSTHQCPATPTCSPHLLPCQYSATCPSTHHMLPRTLKDPALDHDPVTSLTQDRMHYTVYEVCGNWSGRITNDLSHDDNRLQKTGRLKWGTVWSGGSRLEYCLQPAYMRADAHWLAVDQTHSTRRGVVGWGLGRSSTQYTWHVHMPCRICRLNVVLLTYFLNIDTWLT